jgi:chromosome segregation protein
MRVKRLDLFGFKSFPEKTVFDFEPGITCFVGPNGCGKSNVVDALKWVLGEQSVKSLRGKEMQDVIFNGSQGRTASGYAEVTLSFDNPSGRIPVPQPEVSVTRRLYRTGESEYLVNQQVCRLRDVRELFMDTGVGVSAYSFIEQGKVDLLLQSNPKERRPIFEEAAGISRFRAQVHSASTRLERVEANLVRVQDVVGEVDKQLRSIQRQAARARLYRERKRRIVQLQVCLAGRQRRELRQGWEQAVAQREEADRANAELQEKLGRIERAICEAEREREEADRLMRQAQAEIIRMEGDRDRLRERVEADLDRKREQEGRLALAADRAKEQTARLEEHQRMVRESGDLRRTQEETLGRLNERISQEEQKLSLWSEEEAELAGKADGLRGEVEGGRPRLAEAERGLWVLQQEKARCEEGARQLEERIGAARRLAAEQQGKDEEQGRRLEELRLQAERFSRTVSRLQEDMACGRQEEAALQQELEQHRYQLGRRESRKELLAQWEAQGGGLATGVRRVLEGRDKGGTALRGVRGLLAEAVRVPFAYAEPIAWALGDVAQSILVDRLEDAWAVLAFLEGHEGSQVNLLPLDRLLLEPQDRAPDVRLAGVIGRAADLVEVSDWARPAVELLLGAVWIVEDRPSALALWERTGRADRVVTLGGEIYEGNRLIRSVGQRDLLLLPWRSEMQQVGGEVVRLREALEALEARRSSHLDSLQEARRYASEQERRLGEIQDQIAEVERARALSAAERDRLRAESDRANTERQRQVDLSQKAHLEFIERGEEIRAQKERVAGLEETLGGLLRRSAELQQEREVRIRDLVPLREERAGQQGQQRQLLERLVLARSEQDRLERELGTLQVELEGHHDRLRGLEGSIEEAQRRLAELEGTFEGRRQALKGMEERCVDWGRQIADHETGGRALREQARTLEQRLGQARLVEQENRIRLANIQERVRDECQVDLEQCSVLEKEGAWDTAAIESELAELKDKLEKMGGVNLEAIAEHDELSNRVAFLTAQREDMEKAREDLKGLIRKINAKSREMFLQTFEQTRLHFQEMYRKLFGGGKAEVFLENPEDPLESGIEIVARPPGKEPRSISLLSGGEKALTAVALLFAIFKTRPSPFCFLDEVDAPLDETNIDRFLAVLREFLADSQFLIITHNKRTMRIADRLYGITQAQAGVSRKVAMEFHEAAA